MPDAAGPLAQTRDTAWAMSEENVEIVRRFGQAFNEGGFGSEVTMGFFHPAGVFEEPPEQPGAGVARGRESVSRMFTKFDEAWEEHRSDTEEVRVIDDERILVLTIEHFRGRNGIEIDQPSGTIFTLRGGKIARMQSFWERKNAFDAAGLSE